MPRSPLGHPLILTQGYMVAPKTYPATNGHPGVDFRSPLGDDWFACVAGFAHTVDYKNIWGQWNAYGAAFAIDWGQADGSFIRFLYGHGKDRRKELNNTHVEEGRYLCDSGNTGFSSAAHLHFEMRRFHRYGKYWDSKVNARYDLLNPITDFFKKYNIKYT